MTVSGEPVSLNKGFTYKKNGKKSAASAQVLRSGSLKPLEGSAGIKAFIATMGNGAGKGGHKAIFQRVPGKYMNRGRVTDKGHDKKNTYAPRKLKNGKMTKGRQAIKELYGISAPKMAENEKVYGRLEPKIEKALARNLNRFMYQALGEK